MKKAIVCYLSYSGNTKEVAELIEDNLNNGNYKVDTYSIGFGIIPDLSQYDLILIGSFTWDNGGTPDDMKDFVADLGYKPNNIYIFGTGDTQFGGDDTYCGAVNRLARFYNTKYNTLKIEQSPRGSQEVEVNKWIEGVKMHDREINESKNVRASKSE